MLVNTPEKKVSLFFSEKGFHTEFNRFMNLVAVMKDLEDDRLIVRLAVTQDVYFIGELGDQVEENVGNGEVHFVSPTTGKYISSNDYSQLQRDLSITCCLGSRWSCVSKSCLCLRS